MYGIVGNSSFFLSSSRLGNDFYIFNLYSIFIRSYSLIHRITNIEDTHELFDFYSRYILSVNHLSHTFL